MTAEVAIIVGAFGVLTVIATIMGPLLLSLLVGRQAADKERRDYARQDEVARIAAMEKAEDRARTEAVALQAMEAARLVRESTTKTSAQLRVIEDKTHSILTDVNGNMTTARQAELSTTRLVLAALHRVVVLDEAAGRKPQRDDLEAMQVAEERIAELESLLADRALRSAQIEAEELERQAKREASQRHFLDREQAS